MKIYIASKYSRQAELHVIKKQIWEAGHEVVSSWIDECFGFDHDQIDEIIGRKFAMRDLCQISMADVVILETLIPLSHDGGGGREFEAGFAFSGYQHKRFWRVGPAKNPFHYLADLTFENWADCLIHLKGDTNAPKTVS